MNREIIYGIAAIAVGLILNMYSQAMRDVPANQIPQIAASAQQITPAP